MQPTRNLWRWLAIVFFASFAVLLWLGREIYLAAPPIPDVVKTQDGTTLYTGDEIRDGQRAWLAAGGQQLGTVWGHGSYVAPDWSADWLHREAVAYRDIRAAKLYGRTYKDLAINERGAVDAMVKDELRRNTYDDSSRTLTVTPERAAAITQADSHYRGLFGNDKSLDALRERYAMSANALAREDERKALSAFFFWSAWSAVTNRPDSTISYTSNWPHEPLVGNTLTTAAAMWTVASVILLIAGIATMVWFYNSHGEEADPRAPEKDPLLNAGATPSMKATRKYFFVVIGLLLAQVGLGIITAHYAVEGRSLYGFPLADFLPYTVSRTIHTQFGVFWIATAWLATGLYIAPLISGHEPRYQKLGVDALFYALLAIVVGSTAFGWLGVLKGQGLDYAFWIGNQGLEYTSMGRVWQILLFVGLLFWLFLLGMALAPALKKPSESRGIVAMVFLSAACIGGFYAASLAWGQHTHYAMIEYWRWWLVHLWVEGFFEVFATAVVALIFLRLGLVPAASANRAIVLETIVFLFGGILGTLHHLYWTGTPTSVIAVGAVFSALEVVPLSLLGVEAYRNYVRSKSAPWVMAYRWPILCFVAVGFWNVVGAGLLGFSINPPAALYYVQGLNMTPAHGHAALFGVYGMLGIGLMLFCLRGLFDRARHADRFLAPAFWGLNIGLAMMVFLSLLPAGIYQAYWSVTEGLWFARSPQIIHSAVMESLVWLRVPGDIVFAFGVLALALYALKLLGKPPRPQTVSIGAAPKGAD